MKRGQEGGAAALIALIALFMVLYILFLPPAERSKLLGEDKETKETTETTPKTELLVTHPGKVIPKGDIISQHPLPSVILAAKTESVMLDSWNSVSVHRSLLGSAEQELKFSLQNLENTENVLLNFITVKGKGTLTITFNGEQVFSREVTARNIEPIQLKKNLLQKENVLTFKVSSDGATFWQTNYYQLNDITLRGDITDKTKTSSQITFYVDSEEKKLLKRAALNYAALCDPTTLGKVAILLNDKTLFDSAPSCNVPTRIEVPVDAIIAGTNNIQLKSDKGTYKFDNLKIDGALSEPQNYRVYFTISSEQYEYTASHALPTILNMLFAGDEKREGRIFVNNILLALDTGAPEYAVDISSFVRKGYNSIEIDPAKPFEIQEMSVNILKQMG